MNDWPKYRITPDGEVYYLLSDGIVIEDGDKCARKDDGLQDDWYTQRYDTGAQGNRVGESEHLSSSFMYYRKVDDPLLSAMILTKSVAGHSES